MSQHQTLNEAWNQQISQQRNQKKKKKPRLEVHFGVWSMGLGVLKEPFLIIPLKRWVVFFSL